MLKILFSPSEGKREGGAETGLKLSFYGQDEIVERYERIVSSKNEESIKKLFGLKNFNECLEYMSPSGYMKAIERYSGVAYEYLDYDSLLPNEQLYVQENCIIFSNLYGALLGGDAIPLYKVSQGEMVGGIDPQKYYKERLGYQLDLHIGDADVLDLRAGYYDKFYAPKHRWTTLKFLKDSKVVSHWAKAYRGVVLRAVAQSGISTLDEFGAIEIDGLGIKEIVRKKNYEEIVFEIL